MKECRCLKLDWLCEEVQHLRILAGYRFSCDTEGPKKPDDSLDVFTPLTGLAITCKRLLNMNCVMPSIPAELFQIIDQFSAASPSYAKPRSR